MVKVAMLPLFKRKDGAMETTKERKLDKLHEQNLRVLERSRDKLLVEKNTYLQKIKEIDRLSVDRYEPLFIYSADGTRSGQAAAALRAMGYVNAENIGALRDYTGPLEGGRGRAR